MRRILIILILLGVIGGVTWYFGFRPKTSTTGEVSTGFRSFFPLGGSSSEIPENQIPAITDPNTQIPVSTNSAFKQLTTRPIAGYTSFSQKKTIVIPATTPKGKPATQVVTDYFIRYVARQNGFIYEIKNDLAPLQISNIFIPAIYEAFFLDNNTTAILRFLRDDGHTIGSYSVPIPPENPDGTRTQKEGFFLPDNIKEVATSPDSKEFVRLTVEQTQGVITASSSLDKNKKEILRYPLKEWIISWPQINTFYLQTKAAGTVEGFLYKIDKTEKQLRRIAGNVRGLTTSISPSGTFVIYSESTTNGFMTKILNTKTGSVKNTNLSILPEKCVWLSSEDLVCAGNNTVEQGTYPDAWYAGLVSFSDQLFRIYTTSNTFDVIYNNNEQSFDMTNLQIDESRNLLFFIDKKTGFLWQFSL